MAITVMSVRKSGHLMVMAYFRHRQSEYLFANWEIDLNVDHFEKYLRYKNWVDYPLGKSEGQLSKKRVCLYKEGFKDHYIAFDLSGMVCSFSSIVERLCQVEAMSFEDFLIDFYNFRWDVL